MSLRTGALILFDLRHVSAERFIDNEPNEIDLTPLRDGECETPAMRLKVFTDYSLRMLIFLAGKPDRRATIAEIAAVFDISESHLTKVSHELGKAGILANIRGKGGGLKLATEPREISIGQVVRITEGQARAAECFDTDSACSLLPYCGLRPLLGNAVAAFYAVLDRHTLEDITRDRSAVSRKPP